MVQHDPGRFRCFSDRLLASGTAGEGLLEVSSSGGVKALAGRR